MSSAQPERASSAGKRVSETWGPRRELQCPSTSDSLRKCQGMTLLLRGSRIRRHQPPPSFVKLSNVRRQPARPVKVRGEDATQRPSTRASTKAQTEASNARKQQKKVQATVSRSRRELANKLSSSIPTRAENADHEHRQKQHASESCRKKKPATQLKETQPMRPDEPRKTSAAQASQGIASRSAAVPPKPHGSRRKPPAQ